MGVYPHAAQGARAWCLRDDALRLCASEGESPDGEKPATDDLMWSRQSPVVPNHLYSGPVGPEPAISATRRERLP